jgi:hypothetical protein
MVPPLGPPEEVAARLRLLLEASVRQSRADIKHCSTPLLLLAVTLLRAQEEVREEFLGGLQGQVLLQLLLGILETSEANQPGSLQFNTATYRGYGAASAAGLIRDTHGMQQQQVAGATAVTMLVTWCFMSVMPALHVQTSSEGRPGSSCGVGTQQQPLVQGTPTAAGADPRETTAAAAAGKAQAAAPESEAAAVVAAGGGSAGCSAGCGPAGGDNSRQQAVQHGCVLTEPLAGECLSCKCAGAGMASFRHCLVQQLWFATTGGAHLAVVCVYAGHSCTHLIQGMPMHVQTPDTHMLREAGMAVINNEMVCKGKGAKTARCYTAS